MEEQPSPRTQERGRRTRAALVDATLDALVERGYAATTTVEVAGRAGASRGSQVHHFPTRASLLSEAVECLLDRRIEEFRRLVSGVAPGADRLDVAIDVMWSMFEGPAFTAWAELWLAARTDEELRPVVVDMDRRFVAEAQAMFAELFPVDDDAIGVRDTGFAFALALMDGLALQRLVPNDHLAHPAQSIAALKLFARLAADSFQTPEALPT